jgi:hypothetical protein
MITYKDIKKAVNTKLSQEFGIEINSRDVQEGFNRPSFFVQLENTVRSGDESQVHKALTVRIYYFPTDRYDYSIEVLDVQEQLENVFDLKLSVQDRHFNIDEASSLVTDGVLNFSFDIAFYDGRDYVGLENIITEEIENGKEFYEQHPIEKMEILDIEE